MIEEIGGEKRAKEIVKKIIQKLSKISKNDLSNFEQEVEVVFLLILNPNSKDKYSLWRDFGAGDPPAH